MPTLQLTSPPNDFSFSLDVESDACTYQHADQSKPRRPVSRILSLQNSESGWMAHRKTCFKLLVSSYPPPQPFSVNSQTALDSFPMRVHNSPAEALSASPHELIKIPCVIFLHLLQGRIFSHVWMLAVCERVLTVSDALYSICHVQRYDPTEALAGRMDKLLQGTLLRVLSGTIRRTQQI